MNVVLWILQGMLAVVFLGSGLAKLTQPHKKLADGPMASIAAFPDAAVKGIGALEVAGAIGMVLPAVTGVVPVLVGVAAAGLGLVMIGAVVVHARRREPQIIVPVVLLALAAVVAWGRFGPYAL